MELQNNLPLGDSTSKTIDTLLSDVSQLLLNGHEVSDEDIERFGKQLAKTVAQTLKEDRVRPPTLRMSAIGKPDRQLWYEHNLPPEKKEKLSAENYMKFLFGHVLEDIMLFLAEQAGHRVEGQQDEQEIEGVKGHRDAVIDGTLVDVKSASSFSYKKFKEGRLAENDAFGYIPQIQSYLKTGQTDPLITDKDRAAFWVIDKTLGKMCLDFHERDTETDFEELYKHKKEVVKSKDIPSRCYPTKPDGYKNYKTGEFVENGNELLGVNCSYCPFKRECYPGLRVFMSSTGPKFYATVLKEPRMNEVTDEFFEESLGFE